MSKFLITCWHYPGHLYPQIAIATALRSRGHEVAIYSGDLAKPVVESEGFQFFPFRRLSEESVNETLLGLDRFNSDPKSGLDFTKLMRDFMIKTIPDQMADLDPILDEFRPDVVVTDQTMWAPIFVIAAQGKYPVAISSCGAFCLIPGRDVPPFGLGLGPAHNPAQWLLHRVINAAKEVIGRNFRNTLNATLRSFSLPPVLSLIHI